MQLTSTFTSSVADRDEEVSKLSGLGVMALGEGLASVLAKADTTDDDTVVRKLLASSSSISPV